MKTMIQVALTAITFSACTSMTPPVQAYEGRVIEFKSDASGFDTKSYFYEAEQEVIAIDSQFTPELAQASIDHLRKFTQKPISWLIITHPNPDKFNGASVFQEQGAKVLASRATEKAIAGVHAYKKYYFTQIAQMFTEESYPAMAKLDLKFDKEMTLTLKGGQQLNLSELKHPGVSSNQTVVYISSEKRLFVGDLIHHKAHAWLEGGIVNNQPMATIQGWMSDLKELQDKYSPETLVYGGRGEMASLDVAASEQAWYLQKAKALIAQKISDWGDRAELLKGPEAGVLYKELAQEFEKQFPGYALSYMIEYGSYGLVQQML